MPPGRSKAEIQQQKTKLANSYNELLDEFSSKDLRHVGNYTLGRLIGKGSFGKVYLAKHNLTNGSKVVLKSSKKDDSNLAREIHHHRQFVHPHIARLYEVVVTESLVWLALEYCPGDELYNYLLRTGPLPVDKVQKIFTQLVGAVAYIHGKSCVHRDLKLENVLLDKNENVKLCDFGFTREYEGTTNSLATFCGTICYSAPEMLRGEKYAGEKVDVWSLGIILYALLRGELPFDEDDDAATKAKILRDDPLYPEDFPPAAKVLISKLLSKRPLHRPTLADILLDPFFAEYAPQQQVILKLTQPAPFTTNLEKNTLERMRSAGVDIDMVIENVLSQRCDSLAGWWALLIEKEERKEARRERKRKEREADMKILRRLSGASSRLDKIAPTLVEVDEEGHRPPSTDRPRSSSRGRGRSHRRSTPQILVSDLPQLPEGSAVLSPDPGPPPSTPPPPPIEKDSIKGVESVRSNSGSRPPLPPKERRRRSSTLQLVINNPDLHGPSNGISKRRAQKRQTKFLSQLGAIKHWFVESTKRARSPSKGSPTSAIHPNGPPDLKLVTNGDNIRPDVGILGHSRDVSGATVQTRSSYGAVLTPTTSYIVNGQSHTGRSRDAALDTNRTRRPRTSLSPSPVTPRSSNYRRGSGGLRGRKSTSSSVSSVRSMPRRPTHSKASSASSNSLENIHSPGSRSKGRSPHPSVKVLPVAPAHIGFPSNIRIANAGVAGGVGQRPLSGTFRHMASGEAVPQVPSLALTSSNDSGGSGGRSGVVFAKRKKSTFKGPMLNSAAFFGLNVGGALGSPALKSLGTPGLGVRNREGSDGKLNLGLRDIARRASGARAGRRKSQIIEEEDEEEHEGGPAAHGDGILREEDEDEDIEEVEAFSPVEADLERGESVQSVTITNWVAETRPMPAPQDDLWYGQPGERELGPRHD